MDCTKTLVAVLPMTVADAVPDTNVRDAVTSVFSIEIVQFEVLSDADSVTSVSTELLVTPDRTVAVEVETTRTPVAVVDANTAVAVSNGTSIKNHAVPSLAIAQSPDEAVLVIGKNRFNADAVFGVCV